MLDDQQLIARLKLGDKEALDCIYNKYRPKLLAAAQRMQVESSLVEDSLHDVFVSLATRINDLEIKSNLYAYLLTGVVNRMRDTLRKKTRQQKLLATQTPKTEVLDPEQHIIHSEQSQQAVGLLEQLPQEQRQAVSLRVSESMRFYDIARIQGVSASTVRGRYRYGICKLRAWTA
jgi:RNA polymerase sigma-70 factor (ECF subfamily)